jgi:flagellar hook-basal body complex protein FliE
MMAIDSIGAQTALSALNSLSPQAAAKPGDGQGFDDWMQLQLNTANQQIMDAEVKVRELASGEEANIHDVMISLEKAKLSFELILAVRNKSLEAYQELMRMQI